MLDIRGLRGSSGELYRHIALFLPRSRDRFARGARAPFPISGSADRHGISFSYNK